MVTRNILQRDRLQLSYREWSPGGEPVLLLHGLADTSAVWSSLASFLGDNYHCVAPDLRGHGDSDKPETEYEFLHLIADLEALMEHLGWSNAHILAHSFSAKFIPIWAKEYPERFRSMILVDPFFIDKMPSWFSITFPLLYRVLPFLQGMGPFADYETAEAKAKQLKQYRGWSNFQQEVFQASVEQKADGSWGSKFTIAARNGTFTEVMKVAGLTQPLDVPTLFIKPEAGLNRSSWQLKPYQTYLNSLTMAEVPGNHWAFLVKPDAFNRVIGDFLATMASDGN